MANCAKCNAELNPAAKFCAGCGMPVATPAPLPAVNPFAATASPTSKNAIPPVDSPVIITNAESAKRESGAPPRDDTPSDGIESSPVSPLAVSGALSQRGAFQQAVASIKDIQSVPPAASAPATAPAAKKKPGTQVMQNAPNRPVPTPPEATAQPQPPTNKAMRTMAMPNAPKFVVPGASGQAPGPNSAVPQAAAQAAQPQAAAPVAAVQPTQPQAAPAANAAYPVAQGAANTPGVWGWGGGYAPGARVQVTWSNGQRYPATVSQVNGSHCLVVFPDGQQHWVEVAYLSPG